MRQHDRLKGVARQRIRHVTRLPDEPMLTCEPSALEPQIGRAADLFPARRIFSAPRLPPCHKTASRDNFFRRCEVVHTALRAPSRRLNPRSMGRAPWGCINGVSGFLWPPRSRPHPRRLGKKRLLARYGNPRLGRFRRVTEPGRSSAGSTRSSGHIASEQARERLLPDRYVSRHKQAVKNFRCASAISFHDETSRRKEAPDVPHERSVEMG